MDQCEVCTIEKHKYKCPKCKLKYCSVPCYKLHTENACRKETEEKENNELPFVIDRTSIAVPMLDDEPDLVPEERLKLLGENKAVLESLQNPHLREMIGAIAAGENAETLVHDAMMEPIFVEFVDKCLKVVEPASAKSAEDMEVSEEEIASD